MGKEADRLRKALKDWVTYMDGEGYTDKQYKKGMLKQALEETQEEGDER